LHEPVTEARADSASVAILLMPYLPEVYDDRATTIGTLAAGACARIRIKANAWLTGLV